MKFDVKLSLNTDYYEDEGELRDVLAAGVASVFDCVAHCVLREEDPEVFMREVAERLSKRGRLLVHTIAKADEEIDR